MPCTLRRMPTVTVVGSINLDLVATCRRLPRAGETVSAEHFTRHPGGKGANQALAARRAGADVRLVGAVGHESNADEALALLRSFGVDLERVSVVDRPTGLAMIAVDGDGENQIVVVPGANAALAPDQVGRLDGDAILCQLEIPMETVEAAARETRGLFCLNAAPAADVSDPVLERADLIVVNETERDVLGDRLRGIRALVVVTLGAAGARAYRSGRLVAEAHPPSVVAVDTVGAGDAFVGGLVTKLADGISVGEALRWACAAGALATTRPGAQPSLPDAGDVDAVVAM